MHSDPSLDVLLDSDDVRLELSGGYWIKMEARLVDVSRAVPHGIRYSLTLHQLELTLHQLDGKRILGYEDLGVPYVFTSVQQLLNDFWADVNRILQEVGE